VTNQGQGIAPAFLPYVFEAFAQADIRHHSEGQGLSLAIAHRIVRAHDGTIDVESGKGHGTTFTVCLPVAAGVGTGNDSP
jgi:signal transduction histidine kinase